MAIIMLFLQIFQLFLLFQPVINKLWCRLLQFVKQQDPGVDHEDRIQALEISDQSRRQRASRPAEPTLNIDQIAAILLRALEDYDNAQDAAESRRARPATSQSRSNKSAPQGRHRSTRSSL
ncbi:uncharacterized protein EI97DRAFT_483984 [Westerdykella ornata]|uniref:Uncharacterized protein n=1 Tax=Westerdykella ornata TaxID=318751 RepID=A0A6A6J8J4_WESOR|nr:uncharacterized protein EI97DRAFT_483984 [Westerdykella ornata]KAF2272473.1 hypothetical protein EI97DRAFT_483984 [Westerdykella ornata]